MRHLLSLGVSDAQLTTVSYGKDNPRCLEHDEVCWAKNRRAAVKPQNVASRGSSEAARRAPTRRRTRRSRRWAGWAAAAAARRSDGDVLGSDGSQGGIRGFSRGRRRP